MILTRLNNAADGKDGQRVHAHKLWNTCITLKSGECQSVRNFDMKFLASRPHFSKILNLSRSKHLVGVDWLQTSPQSVAGEVLRRLLEDYKANVKLLTKAQSGQWCLSVFERRDKMGPFVKDHTRHKPNRIESLKHLINSRMARQLCKSLKVLDKKLPSSILRRGFAAPRSDVHRHSIGFNFSCLRIHFVFYFELFTLCFWGSPVHARPCCDHARSKFDLTCVYPRDLHWSICKGERRTTGCIGPLGHGSNFCLKVLKSKNILSQTDAAERFFLKDLTSILCVVVAQACVPSIQLEDDFVKYPDQASSFCIWRFSPESQRARQLIL